MRVLLFTGKGGVGKTTVAAATAVRSAATGQRTLVMSTDPAHSLGDSFELEIGSNPTQISDFLWAQQIDAQERLEDNWREIQDYMIQLMNWAGTETIQAEVGNHTPGDAVLFRVREDLQHRVMPLEGTGARTAFAGWFRSRPEFDRELRSAAPG